MLIVTNELATKMTGGAYHILKVAEHWRDNNDVSYLIPQAGCASARKWLKGEVIVIDSYLEGKHQTHCA